MGEGGEVGGVTREPGEGGAFEVVGDVGKAVIVAGDAGDEKELGDHEKEQDNVPGAIEGGAVWRWGDKRQRSEQQHEQEEERKHP